MDALVVWLAGRDSFDALLADGRFTSGITMNVRKSLIGLHHWFQQRGGELPEAEPHDNKSAGGLLEEIHRSWTAPVGPQEGFLWPPYTRLGSLVARGHLASMCRTLLRAERHR